MWPSSKGFEREERLVEVPKCYIPVVTPTRSTDDSISYGAYGIHTFEKDI